MRLAFAVAAHLEPEILVVDEVLAVGDAEFQKKCLGKMGEVARVGRTVLFVSHNMNAVKALCNNAVWLDRGIVREHGRCQKVVDRYLDDGFTAGGQVWSDFSKAPTGGGVRMMSAQLVLDGISNEGNGLTTSTSFDIEFTYELVRAIKCFNLSVTLFNQDDVYVFSSTSAGEPNWDSRPFTLGKYTSKFRINGGLLNVGTYRLSVLFVENRNSALLMINDVVGFTVEEDFTLPERQHWFGAWGGVVRPRLAWFTKKRESLISETTQSELSAH